MKIIRFITYLIIANTLTLWAMGIKPLAFYRYSVCLWPLAIILIFSGCKVKDHNDYTDMQIVNAIYWAEGGDTTRFPYGIIHKEDLYNTTPKYACLRKVVEAREKWDQKGDFIDFLATQYSPVDDPTNFDGNNKYWPKNVKFFLEHPIPLRKAVRAMVGECGFRQGFIGMVAVGHAIRNRGTVQGVWGYSAPKVVNRQYPSWLYIVAALAWWVSSWSADITKGATHWENLTLAGIPEWSYVMQQTFQYRDHTFFKEQDFVWEEQ